MSLLTNTRSPTCSVSSIDPEGMKNACTENVLMSNARTSAMRIRNGNSRRKDPRFFCWTGGSSGGGESPPSAITTSPGEGSPLTGANDPGAAGGCGVSSGAVTTERASVRRSRVALLLDLRLLAAEFAQVVELGPAYVA